MPIPGFCLRNIQKKQKTDYKGRTSYKPVFKDRPSDKTSHGEFPVDEIKIKASPNPKQKRPIKIIVFEF